MMDVATLVADLSLKTDERHQSVERVIATLRDDVEHPFSLDDMADIACFSPYHFARLFRSVTGIPPGEFLAALRFERAKLLILTTDMPVTDVCFEVGYSSLGSFSTRFSELVGMSPASLRRIPELLATEPPSRETRSHSRTPAGRARVSGQIHLARPEDANIFIGLFPAAIASTVPVCGTMVLGPGPFILDAVPTGTYRLLAAAMPAGIDPVSQLLPGGDIQVFADPLPVQVTTPLSTTFREIRMRSLQPTDPPILTALMPLALRANMLRPRPS